MLKTMSARNGDILKPDSKVILDIGASNGLFSIHAARLNPGHTVIAVEPNSNQAKKIRVSANSSQITNLQVEECAIDKVAGTQSLKVSKAFPNQGSLLSPLFDQTGLDSLQVEVKTLRDVIADYQRVDFVKIDAQGKDLDILASASDKLGRVRLGMLEVSSNNATKSYRDEPVLLNALEFLERNSFDVFRISPNDIGCRYFNVFFASKGLDPRQLEAELSLNKTETYSVGKYWHVPSSYPLTSSKAWTKAILARIKGKPIQ